LILPSGLQIETPLSRLRRFCAEEYAFYDAVVDDDPAHVTPVDVAITIAVNSFVNTATRLREIQRGMAAACDAILPTIPTEATLGDDAAAVDQLSALLEAAVSVRGVLVPVATKVLHRKRPSLVPMLDQVILDHYLDATGRTPWKAATKDKRRAAQAAMLAVDALSADLHAARHEFDRVANAVAADGYALTRLRVLDILVWTEVEPRGYYRSPTESGPSTSSTA
jgi:hypothetical protein